jgi:DnaJ-class molecular chaperone
MVVVESECPSCLGHGFFNEEGNPSTDRRMRKCTDCTGTGVVSETKEDFMEAVMNSALAPEKKREWFQICIWEAINEYTQACGGDTSENSISDKRMNAVAKVEKIIGNVLGGL